MPKYIVRARTAVVNDAPEAQAAAVYGSPKYDIEADHFVVNEHTPSCSGCAAADGPANVPSTNAEAASAADILPPELLTPEANALWQAYVDAHFLTSDWQLEPSTTKMQGMMIALEMSTRFLGAPAWQPFERLWQQKHLAQKHNKMKETGAMPKRGKEISKIAAGS